MLSLKKSAIKREEIRPAFKINPVQGIFDLPELTDKTRLDVKYPLMEPYAYAHIYWDNENHELVYELEEPSLGEDEQKAFALIEKSIEELINISFIAIKSTEVVIEYLEKNIRVLLNEFRIKVSDESFDKMMYYIYRDFVGLNEIEPVMKDYYIEDIECNGVGFPIYVVHRKYRNLRTNIIFKDINKLTGFVEKLAQKCGKYISYATPLLDGSLPDGSRANATYTQDITSRGPSFTIRKFTSEPFSPTRMIQLRTVSPEMLAYLWLLTEYESNILVIGGTGSGKTSFLNSIAFFIPPQARIVSIEDTREIALIHENWLPSVAREGIGISSFGGEKHGEVSLFQLLKESFRQRPDYVIVGEIRGSIRGDEEVFIVEDGTTKRVPIKELENKDISNILVPTLDKNNKMKLHKIKYFLKHLPRNKLIQVITKTGRRVTVTDDHSLFTVDGCSIKPIEISKIKNGGKVLIPSNLPCGYSDIDNLYLSQYLKELRVWGAQKKVKKAISRLGQEKSNEICGCVARQYCRMKQKSSIPINKFTNLMKSANIDYDLSSYHVKNGRSKILPLKILIGEEFCRFLGYFLAEGHIQNQDRDVVITNSDQKIINDVMNISHKLFGIKPRIKKVYGLGKSYHMILHSSILVKLLLKLGCGKTASKRVPGIIYGLSRRKICHFLRGLYSGDGSNYKNEISFSTKSEKLAEDVTYLLLSLGIVSRLKKENGKNMFRVLFKRIEDAGKFLEEVGFVQKQYKVLQRGALRSSVNSIIFNESDFDNIRLNRKYRHLRRFGRCSKYYFQKVVTEIDVSENIRKFAEGEFFIDEVSQINEIKLKENEPVYDLSVNPTENFVGGFGGLLLHNSEAFVLFQGMSSIEGEEKIFVLNSNELKIIRIKDLKGKDISKFKVVSLNPETNKIEICKINAFHEHPPRHVLYEIKTEKGKKILTSGDHSVFVYESGEIKPVLVEKLDKDDKIICVDVKKNISESKPIFENISSVLKREFKKPVPIYDLSIQGMQNFVSSGGILLHNSGHPSFGTMHAENVETLIRRLETKPIELSPSLVESLDAVVIMTQIKTADKSVRKVKDIVEIIKVQQKIGNAITNTPFVWDPRTDKFFFSRNSKIFDKLVTVHGVSRQKLALEFRRRTELLMKMYWAGIINYKEVQDIITAYYKTPERVLKKFNIR